MNLGLTMRSIAKNVTFSTGHFKDSKDNDIDISTLLNKGTLAVYMGLNDYLELLSKSDNIHLMITQLLLSFVHHF